jgi:hypothetical protein
VAYFNGDLHVNTGPQQPDGSRAYIPMTKLYCDDCAETAIPLPAHGPNGDLVGRHWHTPFKWAPYYGGDARCMGCGKPC